ncbi:RluA family pseudouridine synthase, partial [Patescibacteria group bacterium]|nr:RluA family pseudouridine synthase [Patescibacteria group bacterium]
MKTLSIDVEEPIRLDKAATQALGLSRTKVQKAIEDGLILVDDEPATAHQLVTADDKITYDPELLKPKAKSLEPPPKLDILYEDNDVLVVNKRAGVLVHETETSTEPTLVDALLAHDPSIAEVGEDPKRAGLVHRLDKAASGLMIVAKTNDALAYLKKQFQERQAKKSYTVLVHGTMEEPAGTIRFPIARSKTHGRMAAKPVSQGGKPAVTHYDIIEQFPHH